MSLSKCSESNERVLLREVVSVNESNPDVVYHIVLCVCVCVIVRIFLIFNLFSFLFHGVFIAVKCGGDADKGAC